MNKRFGAGITLDLKKNEIIIIPKARHEVGYSTYLGTIFYKFAAPYDLEKLGEYILKSIEDSKDSIIVTSKMNLNYSEEFKKLISYSKYKKYISILFEEEKGYMILPYRNYKRHYSISEGDPEFYLDHGTEKLKIANKVIESFEFCK